MLEEKKRKKVARLEIVPKNQVTDKSRAELGLHPATSLTGPMTDCSLFFNWRVQGMGSRSPFARDKCLALLHSTFWLDMAKVDMIAGPMLSEAYISFLIMLASLNIIKLPDWLPEC